MQQYLTLEEAAKILQISADELRDMAKKKTIRAFQDRGTWRFRLQDVEEMARKRGIGSDPELTLGETSKAAQKEDALGVDFSLEDDEVPIGKEKPASGSSRGKTKAPSTPKPGSDSDVRLVLDDDIQFQIDVSEDAAAAAKAAQKPSKSGKKSKVDASDSGVRLISDSPSDSDVKIVPSGGESGSQKRPKSPSDSDIRLNEMTGSGKKKGDANVITEEIDLDAEEAKLTQSGKQGKPKGRGPTQMAGSMLPTESPFELSEPDLNLNKPGKSGKTKKNPSMEDSSSDFEAIPFDASKSPEGLSDDSVDLGSEVAGGQSGNSGINLQGLNDGGISLESGKVPKGGKKPGKKAAEEDSSSEFELSIDDDSSSSEFELSVDGSESSSSSDFEISVDDGSSSEFELSVDGSDSSSSSEFELSLDASDEAGGLSGDSGSESEFELTLDDDGGLAGADEEGRDIFEETNFDVPALEDDSGSEAVAIDDSDTDLEGSDFEISLDDSSSTGDSSGSQVVSLEEDEEADEEAATVARARKPAAKKGKAAAGLVEEDADVDIDAESSAPKKGGKGKKVAVEDDEEDEDGTLSPGRPYEAAPAEWGALPAVLLLPTVIVLFVVGLMGFELMRGMWGYHRPSPVGRPIIDTIARQIDDTLPK